MLKNNLKINISKNFLFCICIIILIFTSFGMTIEDSVAVELDDAMDEIGSDNDIKLENSQSNDILEVDYQDTDVLSSEITVSGNSFDDIRTAVNNAKSGDTIKLSGTYYAKSDNNYIKINKKLNFVGSSSTVLNGQQRSNMFRVVEGGAGSTFKNIKFINGNATTGSAMRISAKNILIEYCDFENNHFGQVGTIYTTADLDSSANFIIRHCKFINNSGYNSDNIDSAGGALAVFGRNSIIDDCYFDSNYVKSDKKCYGGAVHVGLDEPGSNVIISNCIFKNNNAIALNDNSHGGAGCVRNGTTYVNCIFIGNSAGEGGALTFHVSGSIYNCTFINNSASKYGGALSTGYLDYSMEFTLGDCIFEGNNAPDGGAIHAKGLNIYILDSNFTSNSATNCGGAVNIIAKNVIVNNSNFTRNTADVNGGAIFIKGNNTKVSKSSFVSNHAIPDNDKINDGLGGAIYVKSPLTNVLQNNFELNTARNGSAIYFDESGEDLILMDNILNQNQAWVYQLPIYSRDIYYGDDEEIKVVLFGGNNIAKYNNLDVSNAIYNAAKHDTIEIDGESPIGGATDNGRLYQDSREYNMQILLTVTHEDGTVVYNGSSNTSYLGEINVSLNDLKPGRYFVSAQHFEDTYYKGITNVSTFNVIPKVDNKITISTNSSKFNFEDIVIWTLNISNSGPNNSTGVIAYNIIPEGLILLDHNFGDKYDSKTGALNISELNVGDKLTYTVITVVDTTGQIINKVNVTANELDVDIENNFDEAIINVDPASDIAVVKTSSNKNPNYKEYFNWTITVTNNGPDDAHNVSVEDVLPESLIFIGCDGDYDVNTGIWNIGKLENGKSVKLIIQCQVNRTGLAQNNVSANASEFDYDISNNHDEELIYTNPSSDLSIKKEVNASNINYLDIVKWTLTISNGGPDNASDVKVKDVLPKGFIYISSNYNYVNNTFTIEKVNVGEIIVIELISKANITGDFVNLANVTSDNYDYDLTNNEDDEPILVHPASDLIVSKSVDESNPEYHDNVTWTITIKNNGPDTAHNVHIKDLLPVSLIWLNDDSSGKYNPLTGELILNSLESDGEFILNMVCMVNGTGMIQNSVSVNCSEYDYNLTNNEDNETIDVEKSADVSVVKSVSQSNPNFNDLITWTLVISNSGPDKATNVYVDEALPEGLILINYTATKGIYDRNMWAMCCLENGEEQRLEIITRVNKTGKITNIAVIHADEYDSNMDNNEDNESIDVQLAADVEVTVKVNNTDPLFGEVVNWMIAVKNNGPDDATNIVLNEILPDELIFVNYNSTKGTYSNNQWNIPSLKVGEQQFLNVTTISNALGEITNDVDVYCDEYDWNLSNNEDSDNVNVRPVADLTITKLVNNSIPNYGELVKWTLIISNNGPNDATNVIVDDILPEQLKFLKSNGNYANGVWKVGSLDVSESKELEIVCKVIATGSITNHAIIEGDEYDPDLEDNHDNESIYVAPASDLSITKIVSKYKYSVGDIIEYSIEIVNNGPDTAYNIKVSEILDDLLKLKSFKATVGKFNKKSMTWTIDSLSYGQSAKLIIKAIATGAGILNNSVSLTSDTFDWNLENNQDFAIVNVSDTPSKNIPKVSKNFKHKLSKNPLGILEKHKTANPFWSLILALVFSVIFLDARILKR